MSSAPPPEPNLQRFPLASEYTGINKGGDPMTSRSNAWAVAIAVVALLGAGACNRAEERSAEQPAATYGPATDGPSDTVITTNVQAQYYADQTVRGRQIDVSTNNGVVTLRGAVETEQAKQHAVEVARRVEGVREVRDELRVEQQVAERSEAGTPPASAAREGRPELGTARETREDDRNPGWITTKIQAQYFVTPDVRPWNVDVTTTSDGVVTLSGEVESAEGRRKAVEIAQTTEGVTRVEDQLRIRTETAATAGEATDADADADARARRDREADDTTERDRGSAAPLGDTWITAKIQSKYFLDDEVKGREIDVTTMNGAVTLSGTVGSEAEKRQALALARNTDGVRTVNDQLRVEQAATGTAGGAAGDTPGRTDWDVPGVENPFGDEWLTTKIQSKFFLDQSVKGSDINVDTREGVVTLKGQVASEEARRTAEQIARGTAGVQRVNNQLQVGGGNR
jgi:hyperosmotically inducible periplasmic protein